MKNLFDHTQPESLGLEKIDGAETYTIFRPKENEYKYNNGVVLFPFKGKLYAQWQSSIKDEDAPETVVYYSISPNGKNWSKPEILVEEWNRGFKTSGGWWTDGKILVAYICVWPNDHDKPRQGFTEYILSSDGLEWTKPERVTDINNNPVSGIFEQDPHKLSDGRIISAFHMQPGLIVTPYFTDDPMGISGWTPGEIENLAHSGFISRELEPSWFYRDDGAVVMIFRDQNSSFKKLASVSLDRGKTWSLPVLTNMPDSRSKQSSGNLPDGTAYMVGNPTNNKTRIPLAITLSKDGYYFNRSYLIRSGGVDLQPLKFEGKYKRKGFSYPKSVIWNEFLYIAYATNKEDVEYTRIPIKSLQK